MGEEMNINNYKKKLNIQQNVNNKGRLIWELNNDMLRYIFASPEILRTLVAFVIWHCNNMS